MLTRFTTDLWKIAQDGGLTVQDNFTITDKNGNTTSHALVGETLTAFAMQKYYYDNSGDKNSVLFSDVPAGGGIQFDINNVASSLNDAKGYNLYFKTYIANNFSSTEQTLINGILPSLQDWYVQAGSGGLFVADTLNRGAFMLGGADQDFLTGGTGNDLLIGNAGNDFLRGGGGNNVLIGGTGFDTYYAGAGDNIVDSDGLGAIIVDGDTLSGGTRKTGETDFHSDDGKYTYQWSGGDLLINGTIEVKNFTNENNLGVHLIKNIALNPTLTDLGPAVFTYEPVINNIGQIAGSAYFVHDYYDETSGVFNGISEIHAALWQNGRLTDLGRLALDPGDPPSTGPHDFSAAYSINNVGQVVGYSRASWGITTFHAFLWHGSMVDISRDTTNNSWESTIALDINDVGHVVGWFQERTTGLNHAVLWQGGMTDLGSLSGFNSSEAWAINNSGQVVGDAAIGYSVSSMHACLWQNGAVIDLGTLSGDYFSTARDINNAGQVIGYSGISVVGNPYASATHSFLWQNGIMTDLGSFGALDINNIGQILGYSKNSGNYGIWQNGVVTELSNFLPAGWTLQNFTSFNDNGQLLGFGTYNGVPRNFILRLPSSLLISASSINENVIPHSIVGTLSCTDSDKGNIFSYSLVNGTGSTDNSTFSIAGNQLQINSSPNFETKSSYSILVRTTDQSGTFFDKAVTINITDINEAPTNLAITASYINENVAANSVVGILSSTDPDANNTFTYSLAMGGDNAAFTIVGNQLRINNSPSFESQSSYNIGVSSTDQNGLSFYKDLTITINIPPTGTVTISGTATQNQTLTASNTLADANGLGAINYQWQANGIAINGAINNTYALTLADAGKAITVVASYIDGMGTPEAVTSTAVTISNTAPSFNLLNGTPSHTEGGAAVVLDADVQIYDAELSLAGTYSVSAP